MKEKLKNSSLAQGPKNLIFIVGFFLMCIILLTKLTDYTRQTKNVPYSDFLNSLERDEVKSVHISGQDVSGFLNDGSRFETVIVENAKNLDLLREHKVEVSVATPVGQLNFWHLLLIIAFVLMPMAIWYFLKQSKGTSSGGGGGIFNMGKNKSKLFMPSTIKINFSSVAGAKEAKEELEEIVDFLKNPEKYKRLGAKISRGVLLIGEPGNGKTLLAKAVAGEANCPFFSITGSDFIEVFVGVGAARVRDLFAQARKHAPSIIFIDEIDAIGRQRGVGFGGGHDEREQTLNQLLTEMDGFETSVAPVIVLAATNMADVLDKALLRPGRFDRRIDVPFPDLASREEILKIHAKGLKLATDVDLLKIAQDTAGFSGADLANLMNKAALNASKTNQDLITMKDIEEAHKSLLQINSPSRANSNPLTQGTSKAKMFMPAQVKTSFKDVAGVIEAKEELKDIIDFLKEPARYKRLGAKIPRGVLLVGEPGNGKTLLARAVAGEANCPFFNVSASEFIEMYVGVGAARVRDLFAQARKHSPSIIFIDEIDAAGGHRSSGNGGNDERNQTLNQLLTEMDGFDSATHIIVIAATNRADTLDAALKRRFSRRIDVGYPNQNARLEILKVHTRDILMDPSVDLLKIARGTGGFSGSSLANLVNEAALLAAQRAEEVGVTPADFDEARDKILVGKEAKATIMNEQERQIIAYHESGHALIRLLLPEYTDPLHKVTILPRGPAALGITWSLPERDHYIKSKEQFLSTITSTLGGRAAEDIMFNLIATGAGSDFKQATEVARKMVCLYGMSEELGMVSYDSNDPYYQYSQKTAEKIDDTVKKILNDCYKNALELLRAHIDKLHILSAALLEKETLEAHEVYKLLGITPRADLRIAAKAA